MVVQGGEVVADARQGGDGSVVGSGGIEALVGIRHVEEMALRDQFFEKFFPNYHHAQVGAVGFVGAEHVGVGVQCVKVGPAVWGVGHAVHDEFCANVMH